MHDLAIIVVSTNEAHWLRPALSTVFAHAGDVSLDVVVADNESTDGTRELVESEFPEARVVECANHGFAHANNRAWMTTTLVTRSSSIRTPRSSRARSRSSYPRWTNGRTSVWPASSR